MDCCSCVLSNRKAGSLTDMIEFKDVNLEYGDRKIFSDFSMKVEKGEKAIITGPSGLGKSSIFSMILGFVKPSSGKIVFDGKHVDEKNIWDVRTCVAYVDQDVSIGRGVVTDFFYSIFSLKANSNISFDKAKIMNLFDGFGLQHEFMNKRIENLSRGEKQRVALIGALLLNRPVFLLDEVTAALDDELKLIVANYFLSGDFTVVSISHDTAWLNASGDAKVFDMRNMAWKL